MGERAGGDDVIVLRRVLGGELRRHRLARGMTLKQVGSAASVSHAYISEVERGEKEASSEMLAAICAAMQVPMSQLLRDVSDEVASLESTDPQPTVAAAA